MSSIHGLGFASFAGVKYRRIRSHATRLSAASLALALAALPALRRLQSAGGKGQRRLRCEEVLALDGRHRVALLRVDDRELLVSLQADGSRLLLDLGADGAAATAPAADFSSAMRRARA